MKVILTAIVVGIAGVPTDNGTEEGMAVSVSNPLLVEMPDQLTE